MRFLRSVFLCFSLLTALLGFSQSATFTTIPAAVNGTINVCAGSTILFNSTVNPATLFAPAIYSWNFGNGQTSSIPGPVGITYATAGTYTATLNISSAGVPLTQTTVTINVSAAPAVVPTFSTVGNANNCEQLYTVNGVPMIQTTGNNCSCNQFTGPMISLNNANLLPAGSSATILWGGNGIGGASTTFPVGTSNLLAQTFNFPGQQNNNTPASHYNTPGSYNLMYLVTFPNGCTYSTYVIMSYGAGAISLGSLSAQLLCNPLNYNLTFANQTPGNTYVINWGDGSPNTTYTYPNLPLVPNGVPHQYSPSACVNGVPQDYTITVTATNPCPGSTTTSTLGPFNVSQTPNASFTSNLGNFICQNQSITFTNTSTGGLSINNGQCSNAYNFGWQIDYSSSLSGPGYQVTSGSMGDPNNSVDGSNVLTVQFTQPGTYTVSLDAANNACGMDTYVYIITVNGVDAGPNQSVCAGNAVTLTGAGSQNCTWNNGVVNGVPFIPLTTQTYTLSGTNTNGCAGIWNNTDQVTVTVNPLPTVSAGNNQSVCAGSPVTLSGAGASTYSWNNGDQNGFPFSPTATHTSHPSLLAPSGDRVCPQPT
jgi:PKD repeat protein